jgi:hypothetical protein
MGGQAGDTPSEEEPTSGDGNGDSGDGEHTARLSYGGLAVVLVLWVVTSFFGTAALYATRSVSYVTEDGSGIERCGIVARDLVESGDADDDDWCSTVNPEKVADRLPATARAVPTALIVDRETIGATLGETLFRPDMWLAAGLGSIAICMLFIFSRVTGTLRAGLAASISVVFFGMLLLPSTVTFGLPDELEGELVDAWGLMIAFYFGSEAAVQAVKVLSTRETNVQGDVG